MDKVGRGEKPHSVETCSGLDDPKLDERLPANAVAELREQIEMVRGLCPAFDVDAYLAGNLTPVYFGSAINSFGVNELLDGLVAHAPPPQLPGPAVDKSCRRISSTR